MRLLKTIIMAFAACTTAWAQPRYDFTRLQTERLNRGVVAVRTPDGKVAVSWRTLKSDRKGEAFDIYRNGKKLNPKPLTKGGTFYIDNDVKSEADVTYAVKGGGIDGEYVLRAEAKPGYHTIALQKPEGGTTPDGRPYQYSANDASIADVDGDGQYEIVLKWDPTNARDNAHAGFTGPTLFDCYRLDGTRLWRIDMGHNIRSGAHYVPFIFYDLNGDGRAEFIVRTSDGTRDALGNVIGNAGADYREKERGRYQGRILHSTDYISVFDGLTGKVLDSKPYIPQRGNPQEWGDDNANRSDRMLAAVGYLDGQHASAIFCRGYYTRTVIAAWDWNGQQLREHWTFDTNQPEWRSYDGQGNHNLRVADVDGDGCDEITYGSMAVDHDGRGLYNTGFGHGDAMHLIADPQDNQLYIWDCHENKRDGSDLRNARTGEVVFQVKSRTDVGRCMAADIDPTNPGCEMWSSDSHGIRTMKGDVLYAAKDADDPQHDNALVLNGRWLSVNFGIWWDGDLLRELLDRETVTKYDWKNHSIIDVQKFEGVRFNNGTKSNPCLQADMLGDWREEVMVKNRESTELRIYTTTIPTDYRIDCLMHDVPYRLSVAYQNVGYNQPPEPGYYIGPDKKDYLK